MIPIKDKYITECGDLRLLLTNLHPDVDSLIAMHQAHPSH